MKALTLDCSTFTGWATNGFGTVESGVQQFDLRRGESAGMRFVRFRIWLRELVLSTGAEILVFEQAHHRGGAATELCVGFTTRVQEIAAELKLEYKSVHSGTLKLFATGKGNADKEQMIRAASDRFGRTITDDNEADALMLLAWVDAGMPEGARKKSPRKRKAA